MKCKFLIGSLFLSLAFFNLKAQDIHKFFGEIRSYRDTTIIEDVHVINLSKKLGTTSNRNGLFKISVSIHDSILFSVLGYEFEMIIIDSSHIESEHLNPVVLNPKTYSLPDIYVWPYLTYAEFRQAFINFDRETPEIDLRLPKGENEMAAAAANPHISLGSPITALYMQFSKEGKELRKYAETLERDNYERFLATKYNDTMVKRVTGIKTMEEVREFMKYCNFADDFIARSSEYDIYAAILNCYNRYLSENSN